MVFPLRMDLIMTLVYRAAAPMDECLAPTAQGVALHTAGSKGVLRWWQ